jgi:hypothetical protein
MNKKNMSTLLLTGTSIYMKSLCLNYNFPIQNDDRGHTLSREDMRFRDRTQDQSRKKQ